MASQFRVKHSTTEPLCSLELACKLINRAPGSRHLVSSLPGSALRTHVELLGMPGDSSSRLEVIAGKLCIKRLSPSIQGWHNITRLRKPGFYGVGLPGLGNKVILPTLGNMRVL